MDICLQRDMGPSMVQMLSTIHALCSFNLLILYFRDHPRWRGHHWPSCECLRKAAMGGGFQVGLLLVVCNAIRDQFALPCLIPPTAVGD